MTTIEKHIVKFIDDKFGFPYMDRYTLYKKFGKGYIDNVLLTVVGAWFKNTYKLEVKEIE